MKPVTTVTAVLLGVVSLAHALRFVLAVPVTVGAVPIPLWVSIVGTALPAGLSFGLWRERS